MNVVPYDGDIESEGFGITVENGDMRIPQVLWALMTPKGIDRADQVYRMLEIMQFELLQLGVTPEGYEEGLVFLFNTLPDVFIPRQQYQRPRPKRGMGALGSRGPDQKVTVFKSKR